MCELPRRIKDHFEHQVAGQRPESDRGERRDNDSRPAMSLSKSTCDTAPQQQERDSWGDGKKEQREKSAAFQNAPDYSEHFMRPSCDLNSSRGERYAACSLAPLTNSILIESSRYIKRVSCREDQKMEIVNARRSTVGRGSLENRRTVVPGVQAPHRRRKRRHRSQSDRLLS